MASKRKKGPRINWRCRLLGHKFDMPNIEMWQLHRDYIIGCCARCRTVGVKFRRGVIHWSDGVIFDAHREQGRLLGLLDKPGWIEEKEG